MNDQGIKLSLERSPLNNSFLKRQTPISRTTFSLLQNNPIDLKYYRILITVEGLFLIVLSYFLYQRTCLNFKSGHLFESVNSDEDISEDFYQSHIIPFIERYYLYGGLFVFFYLVILILGFSVIALIDKKKGTKLLKKTSTLRQIYVIMLVLFTTIFKKLFLIIIIHGFRNPFSDNRILKISFYGLTILSAVLYVTLLTYTQKLFKLSFFNEIVPWSSPNTKNELINLISEILIVILLQFQIQSTFQLIVLVSGQLLQIVVCYLSITQVNFYEKSINYIKTFFKYVSLQFYFQALLPYIVKDQSDYQLIIIVILLVFMTLSWVLIYQGLLSTSFQKLITNNLKTELDHELALFALLEIVKACIKKQYKDTYENAKLYQLIENHSQSCAENDCVCHQYSSYISILKEFYKQGNLSLVQLSFQQYQSIKLKFQQKSSQIISNILHFGTQNYHIQEYSENLSQKQEHNFHSYQTVDIEQTRNVDRPQHAQKNDPKLLKLQQHEIMNMYLIQVVEKVIRNIKSKYTQSLTLQYMCCYFYMFVLKKPHKCITELRGFEKQNPNFFEQRLQFVNEMFFVEEFKKQSSNQRQKKKNAQDLNVEFYLQINGLYDELYNQTDELAFNLSEFWNEFTLKEMKNGKIENLSQNIAQQIRRHNKIFKKLDQIKEEKSFMLYYQYAIMQHCLFNNKDQYQLYVSKLKLIQEQKSILKLQQQQFKFSEQCGLAVVDAKQLHSLHALYFNKSFVCLLEFEKNQANSTFSIQSLMPHLISENHHKFIDMYQATGNSPFINTKRVQFLKSMDGSIKPFHLLLKFFMLQTHGYSFLASIQPIQEIAPFKSGQMHQVNNLFYFNFDHNEGRVFEISKNFKDILLYFGFEITSMRDIDLADKKVFVEDMISGFDIVSYSRDRMERNDKKVIYEQKCKLCLKQFQDHRNQITENNTENEEDLTLEIRISMFDECYSHQSLWMTFGVFEIIDQSYHFDRRKSIYQEDPLTKNLRQLNPELPEISLMEHQPKRDSIDLNVSSASSNTFQSNLALNHELTSFQSPKSLKIVIYMIILLMFTSTLVSSVILTINTTKGQRMVNDLQIVRKSYERINLTAMNRMVNRILLNIANGYEPDSNELLEDRFQTYVGIQALRINQLRDTQHFLDNSEFDYSDEFKDFMQNDKLALRYLNSKNERELRYEPMPVASNIYTTNLNILNNYSREQLRGNLNIQTLTPIKDANYTPTEEERRIYFCVHTGNDVKREYNWKFTTRYVNGTKEHIENQKQSTTYAISFSVAIIFIVGLSISPLISKSRCIQYEVLENFNSVSKDQIQSYIQNCSLCQKLLQESLYGNSIKDEDIEENFDEKFSMYQARPTFINEDSLAPLDPSPYHNQIIQSLVTEVNDKQVLNGSKSIKEISEKQEEDQQAPTTYSSSQQSWKIKRITFVMNILLSAIIASYFVLCYYNDRTFSTQAIDCIGRTQDIYFKDACITNALVFERENQIRNETVYLSEKPTTVASTAVLSSCFQIEKNYFQVRKDPPPYFGDAKQFMNDIESDKLCDAVFQGDLQYKLQKCKTHLNSIHLKGLSITLSYMYAQLLQIDSSFFSKSTVRDYEYLYRINTDKLTIDIIDSKEFFLQDVFDRLKDVCEESSKKYFNSLLRQNIYIYVGFIVMLIFGFIVFLAKGFRRLKNQIWNSYIILSIIPREELSEEQLSKIKNQFK